MTRLNLEDFGQPAPSAPPPPDLAPPPGVNTEDFDTGYNSGWDDAMAQIQDEQGRIGEKLADRLLTLERDQRTAITAAISALEPLLHDVFDKLLPRAAERAFLAVLLEEIQRIMEESSGKLMLQVAPEEAGPLANLLDRAGVTPDRVTVRPEPALALSQALVRWDDQERRIDLDAVLAALDNALEDFLASIKVDSDNG